MFESMRDLHRKLHVMRVFAKLPHKAILIFCRNNIKVTFDATRWLGSHADVCENCHLTIVADIVPRLDCECQRKCSHHGNGLVLCTTCEDSDLHKRECAIKRNPPIDNLD
jgi:hypothetical protein